MHKPWLLRCLFTLGFVFPLGAVLLEVAWSPTLKANDGIGGSYSPWTGGQLLDTLVHVVYKDVRVEVTLGLEVGHSTGHNFNFVSPAGNNPVTQQWPVPG
ncbi:hypothetical protein Tco_1303488 [Tanacetum coccineum]